ncbi:MAG TPA: hypothetical protein VIF12_01950 [Micavibrio sp.]|jgi:ABC-type enterochelin transport system permease subunit
MKDIKTEFLGREVKGVKQHLALVALLISMSSALMSGPVVHSQEGAAIQSADVAQESDKDEDKNSLLLLTAVAIVSALAGARFLPRAVTAVFNRFPEHFSPRNKKPSVPPQNLSL